MRFPSFFNVNTLGLPFRFFIVGLFGMLIAGASFIGGSASAQTSTCALPDLETTTELKEQHGRIKFSNGFSGKQLERKRRAAGGAPGPGPEWHPVGLMGRDMIWEISVDVRARKTRTGYCVGLKHVEMTVGFDRIDVYVDRRYRPGSCEYSVILEHENEHVENFKTTLADYMPDLGRKLSAEAGRLPPRITSSPKRGAAYFARAVKKRVTPIIRHMQKTMDEADRRIDTPENYRAIQARCDSW